MKSQSASQLFLVDRMTDKAICQLWQKARQVRVCLGYQVDVLKVAEIRRHPRGRRGDVRNGILERKIAGMQLVHQLTHCTQYASHILRADLRHMEVLLYHP